MCHTDRRGRGARACIVVHAGARVYGAGACGIEWAGRWCWCQRELVEVLISRKLLFIYLAKIDLLNNNKMTA